MFRKFSQRSLDVDARVSANSKYADTRRDIAYHTSPFRSAEPSGFLQYQMTVLTDEESAARLMTAAERVRERRR